MSKICKDKKYHYFYKITNNINQHFYYGIRSTDDINDGYMSLQNEWILGHKYNKK